MTQSTTTNTPAPAPAAPISAEDLAEALDALTQALRAELGDAAPERAGALGRQIAGALLWQVQAQVYSGSPRAVLADRLIGLGVRAEDARTVASALERLTLVAAEALRVWAREKRA